MGKTKKREQTQWITRLSAEESERLMILAKFLYYDKKIPKIDRYHVGRYALQWLLRFLDANKEEFYRKLQKSTES